MASSKARSRRHARECCAQVDDFGNLDQRLRAGEAALDAGERVRIGIVCKLFGRAAAPGLRRPFACRRLPAQWSRGWLLDRDITKVAPEEILKTKVLRTVVGGKTVYEAK